MKKYSNAENELIIRIKNGDNSAFEPLCIRYLGLIRSISTEYKAVGYDTDDFIQEGLLGLWNAVKSFDSNKASFKNYAMKCIKNRFVSIARHSSGKGSIPYELTVPIDDLDIIDYNQSPDDLVLFRESLASFYECLKTKLSERERSVMELYIQGYSQTETASRLGITKKAVDNALSRAKAKLNDI